MQNWIETTFNIGDGPAQGLALVISLSFVLILFALFVFVVRRLMSGKSTPARGRQPRIALMDSTSLDGRRRLLLVRRDNVEHLILVGGPTDVVVEQNIVKNAPLTSAHGRPAAYAANAPAATGVKAAIAPGPDIPVTPEAGEEARLSAAPVGADAEPVADPVSLAQVKRALETGSAPSANFQDRPKDRPKDRIAAPHRSGTLTTSGQAPDVRLASSPTASQPSKVSAPAKGGDTPADPASRSKLARSTHKAQPATPPSPQSQGSLASRDTISPSQKPTAPVLSGLASELQAPTAEERGQRTAPRPFSPKDRPSYGSAKISPPASGPAARAKTVIAKPGEGEPGGERIEPTLQNPQTTTSADTASLKTPSAAAPAASGPVTSMAAAAKPASKPLTAPDAKAAATAPSTTPGSPTSKAAPSPLSDDGLEDILAQPASPDDGAPGQPGSGQPGSGQGVAANSPQQAKASEENRPIAVADGAPKAETGTKGSPDQTPAASGAASGSNITTGQRPATHGLGDRNPIEDEMAKILNELGGQPKQ